MRFLKLTTRRWALVVAVLAMMLAAERFGEERARRYYPKLIKTVTIRRGARAESFTYDTNRPEAEVALARMLARLRDQKVEFRVQESRAQSRPVPSWLFGIPVTPPPRTEMLRP